MKKIIVIALFLINLSSIYILTDNRSTKSLVIERSFAGEGSDDEEFQGMGYCKPFDLDFMCVSTGKEDCTQDCPEDDE